MILIINKVTFRIGDKNYFIRSNVFGKKLPPAEESLLFDILDMRIVQRKWLKKDKEGNLKPLNP